MNMKRCLYLTCEGYKLGVVVNQDKDFSTVMTLDGKEIILKNWKVMEVNF